jgi:hypothetical protein
MGAFINLAGKKFGRLTVVRRGKNNGHYVMWLCACRCGGRVITRGSSLTSGNTRSCGCMQRDAVSRIKHGHCRNGDSKTYRSWSAMHARCTNPGDQAYDRYGGRGIKVCRRWLRFENFLADMGERPVGKTLDRYPDNDGDYKPSNCRWATPRQQQLNRGRRR